MSHLLGTHYDSLVGLISSAELVLSSGGSIIQIFLTTPSEKHTHKQNKLELLKFKKYLDAHNMGVVVHSSYLHNIARSWDKYSYWIKNIELELKYCKIIGAVGLVLHLGKQLDMSKADAYNNMYTSLVYICSQTKKYGVPILLETSSGQGSEMCYVMEDLSYFYKKFAHTDMKDMIKICLDTCHVFAAGYDLRTNQSITTFLQLFDELIGVRNIKLIHLNDSKFDIESKRDVHDNIGNGYIGKNGLVLLYKYFKKLGVPIILETPNYGFRKEIKYLLES